MGLALKPIKLASPKKSLKSVSLIDRDRSGKIRRYVLGRDNYTCAECKEPYPEYHLECDHIIPLSQGGFDIAANCQALCIPCHAAKTKSEREDYDEQSRDI